MTAESMKRPLNFPHSDSKTVSQVVPSLIQARRNIRQSGRVCEPVGHCQDGFRAWGRPNRLRSGTNGVEGGRDVRCILLAEMLDALDVHGPRVRKRS